MKIVMYHYIRNFNKQYPYFKTFLSKKNFLKQIKYFQNNLGVIKSENEFYQNQNKFLLTFDDGLKEQVYAAKILAQKNLTGIFFIPTKPLIENKFLDVHKIHLLIGKVGGKKLLTYLKENKIFLKNRDLIKRKTYKKFSKVYTHNEDEKANIYFKKYMNYLLDQKSRTKLLDELISIFKVTEKVKNFYMSKSDIKYIKKLGMIVGSHGHSHQLFSKMEKKNQNIEIYKSKKVLEKITKSDVNMFCYPYGRKYSYNLDTLNLIKKNKFNFAFSVTSKNANINKISTRFELPRYDTNEFLKNEKNTTITR